MKHVPISMLCLGVLAACGRADHIGKAPSMTPPAESREHSAMVTSALPLRLEEKREVDHASLWSGSRHSLLGDRRAMQQGDILTVVIEIDEKAEISNATDRSRSGSETLGIDALAGLPQRLDQKLPEGASSSELVGINSASASSGDGSVKRKEKLTLRIAATIVDVLPNGVLSIAGSQELRVNFELRELLVTGYVRPADVSRKNEITYDKIASARVSYGGRGQITDVQQPRIGQQVLDVVSPF
ncbi:flagellar basal body L-ring protein FlgH [Sulfitobacter mediterraneus]|uniref:flagellar basal body L-ring protein FlgH n=1 Tax=Sulfitobacter mediterraneus TaxID=83219 RepID=UPI0019345967|nr:flagellar basal body L-ring protein FlgH [Sulfitobacter mediterraneus]MBM1308780.1 flagellar basal body L-ring protein FlgH [Sulfitobacter mediterraneus]MBM1312665.1 flagellar basal body L-ring protein FlgH [Sulfitobacter mediterraneus]MBM1321047.1 flagellar basal body L-ring protein FlgH [Sulfitobacter mediterraneus]MBM1324934.1 flagellar basal body L-ring protein FlgH [Sulfitobacter mediterraneus]MBM1396281.1 flagellar basal body L-ring protein FlgH [Sulfitobacter mediterraneus]